MTTIRAIKLGLAAVLLFTSLAATAAAQTQIGAATQKAAVEDIAKSLRRLHVDPAKGDAAAQRIEAALAAGDYALLDTPEMLARKLLVDLRAAGAAGSIVGHVPVRSITTQAPAPVRQPARGVPAASQPLAVRSEAGVVRADLLQGNIGYLKLKAPAGPDVFSYALDRAMAPLANTRALIIDLRQSGGGHHESDVYFLSHFFAPGTRLGEIVTRAPGATSYTRKAVASLPTPVSYRNKPVVVLIGSTSSGSEWLAYELQARKIAVVVGRKTDGNSPNTARVDIGPIFTLSVQNGRWESAATAGTWEGVGVTPDFATPADEALRKGLQHLGLFLTLGTSIDTLSKERVFAPRTKPNLASEAAIRRLASEIARGAPDYARMGPGMAQRTRETLVEQTAALQHLGALQSVTFDEVNEQGLDVFNLKFSNGSLVWRIALGPDGRAMAWHFEAPR